MMNAKERLRLKEFRNYIDFLDNSQDIQDHGRFIDTLQALYEDGWFDWIYLYAKEQTERVQELEDKLARIRFVNNDYDKQNKRYREAIEKAKKELEEDINIIDCARNAHYTISKALEGEE